MSVRIVFLFIAFIFLVNPTTIYPMEQVGMADSLTLSESGEKISLYTDRSIYCVNEKIYFAAEYSCIKEMESSSWSNVLYVELLKWNGGKLAWSKLKLDKSGSSGSLRIPDHLLSGNYYLRAYTKWMRNFSVSDYGYMPIKIVNPFEAEIDAGPSETSYLQEASLKRIQKKEVINGLKCTMDKYEYEPGEKAIVELSLPDKSLINSDEYCVSVAKTGLIDTSFLFFKPDSVSGRSNLIDIEYLPEIRGITVSGKIIDKTTNTPKEKVLVSLSEPLNGEYYSVYRTNDKGRFIFSLSDFYGKYDFFIQAETPDTQASEILIDNDYCNNPVSLPYIPFRLNKEEKHLIQEMVINQQLSEKYLCCEDSASNSQSGHKKPLVFYGSNKKTYFASKYIELPNIEEFFIEIVSEILVVYDKGKPLLKNAGRTNFSNYPPLILLDNIPVHNDEGLLKIPMSRIERVEVNDMGYMVGNSMYDGLISIYSKNKDFAGIDLNKNSMFFTYELYSDEFANSFSEPSNDSRIPDSRIPDRRNLLYWNPDIKLSVDQKTGFSFHTSNSKGDYVVFVRGKNNTNDFEVYGTCFFSVR